MRRSSVRTLILVPWIALTLATVFVFLAAADEITDQLIAVAILSISISIPVAYFVSVTLVNALHELRSEAARLARLRSSPVDPYSIQEVHSLRTSITTATDELHSRIADADFTTARLRAPLESLTEGVILLSGSARFVTANAAARELLRLPANVDGQAIAALVRNAELRKVLADAVTGALTQPAEMTLDERQLLISPRRLRYTTGDEIPGVVVGIVDLTMLRKLETVRRDFVANVSHEFKTPLTSIRGYTETLLQGDVEPEQQREFLAIVRKNADRLQRLVEDLLDLSRLQSGGWQPEIEVIDARALVEDVWKSLDAGRTKDITVNIAGDEQVFVAADQSGLRQVLANVLENAVRYTSGAGRISVAFDVAKEMVRITISDTGSGIPRDVLPRIFERFYRTDAARARGIGGTGLGLAIVKHLVERMDGEVSAESEVGKGTTIRILMPAAHV